jgi:predicted transcriptional regulator
MTFTQKQTPKVLALDLIQRLRDDVTLDDIMYEIYVIQKIERGLKDVEQGRTTKHEDFKEEISQWYK